MNIKYKATRTDWAKAIVYSRLYLAFLAWVDAWWGVIVLPLLFDAYVTRIIPWTWWKDAENPLVRLVMSWVDAIVFALVAVYFVNIYFFQKWVPWLGSTWKESSPASTIACAALMCGHLTGIPSQGSLLPHLPGPTRI